MKALIGIMPDQMFRQRIMAVVKGEYVPEENAPKIWFTSLLALGQILSNENIELLRMMAREKPESLSELARLSGRHISNLSTTMKTLEGYGFAKKVKSKNTIMPVAVFTDFEIRVEQFPPQEKSEAA